MRLSSDYGEDQNDEDNEATEAASQNGEDNEASPQRPSKGSLYKARVDWPESHESVALGFPTLSHGSVLDQAQLRARLAQRNAIKGVNPGTFDNLYSLEDEPSLLMICSQFSGGSKTVPNRAEKVPADLHAASRRVILTSLMPQLKPYDIVALMGKGMQLHRRWCYMGSTETQQLKALERWEQGPKKTPFGQAHIRFTESNRRAPEAGCRTTCLVKHGSDGWSSELPEWTKLENKVSTNEICSRICGDAPKHGLRSDGVEYRCATKGVEVSSI